MTLIPPSRRTLFCFQCVVFLAAAGVLAAVALGTEQGTLIHFPAKMTDDWAPAEAAAGEEAAALGRGAWLRFDDLWHEQNWEPFAPAGEARVRRIVALCKRLDLRPLMGVVPHPWDAPVTAWALHNRVHRTDL